MEEQRKLAFEFARDTSTQLITVASGIIALSITFAKDFLHTFSPHTAIWAYLSWISLLISVACGLATLMGLTGSLEPVPERGRREEAAAPFLTPEAQREAEQVFPTIALEDAVDTPSIRTSNVTVPALLQVATFLVGLLLAVAFGITAATHPATENTAREQVHSSGLVVTHYPSIGPFDTGSERLSRAGQMLAQRDCETIIAMRAVYELEFVLILGRTDKQRLGAMTSRRFESNFGLGQARAKHVKEFLLSQIRPAIDSSRIQEISVGPQHVGEGVSVDSMRSDRSVEVLAFWSSPADSFRKK